VTGLISIVNGDALHIPLQDSVVQIVITSPPYWGLRDYGTAKWVGGDSDCLHSVGGQVNQTKDKGTRRGEVFTSGQRPGVDASKCRKCGAVRVDSQLGLEPTPEAYIANMVAVFREVWRVMRPDGTLWLNIGDCYNSASAGNGISFRRDRAKVAPIKSKRIERGGGRYGGGNARVETLKPKDLMMMPARLALALQADGWWIRSDIIWAKSNPMPESVTDRPTKSYEHVFLLTKSASYYYDAEAIKENLSEKTIEQWGNGGKRFDGYENYFVERDGGKSHIGQLGETGLPPSGTRNRRDVWTIATESFSGAHFATFPQKLVEPMILAGSSPQACETCGAPWERILETRRNGNDWNKNNREGGDRLEVGQSASDAMPQDYQAPVTLGWRPTCACPPERNTGAGRCIILDPFAGTGTVGKVAVKHGRRFVGLELKPEYIELARARTDRTQMAMQV